MSGRMTLIVLLCLLCSSTNAQLPATANEVCPLLIGNTLPDVAVKNIKSEEVNITSITKGKPAVIIFYRGGWCPYCNIHLSELAKIEKDIIELGYQIIAISPDIETELVKTLNKNELKYQLFTDSGGSLAKAMGIAFKAPEKYKERLHHYSGGANGGYLPVPSVFVIDANNTIQFEYVNPNYKARLSSAMLLAILRTLKSE